MRLKKEVERVRLSKHQKPLIGITLGDFNGVGPEVTLKCLHNPSLRRIFTPLLLGPPSIYEAYARLLRLPLVFETICHAEEAGSCRSNAVLPIGQAKVRLTPGRPSTLSGRLAGESISWAIELCRNRSIDAMVTAPISKEAMMAGGFRYPGHTEFLATSTGSRNVIMVLVGDRLRVGLVTGHVPVCDIPAVLTRSLLAAKLRTLVGSLRRDFGISSPRVAVLGLNPHAGEGGTIGREETSVIEPVIRSFRRAGHRVDGPFAADGYWATSQSDRYDATLALYHDQGLIPFKMRHFNDGVNFTAGLPIIRTSPDHGTAFPIAGKNKADPGSMAAAIRLAVALALKRGRRRND